MTPPETAPATATTVGQPIRFREDTAPGASGVIEALLLTVLLLAAALGAAIYAKKRGWLQRWTVGATSPAQGPSMQVSEVLRLSPRTRLYRVRTGDGECLVLESTSQASIVSQTRGARDVEA